MIHVHALGRLTRNVQTKPRANTARRTLPTSRKSRKGSNSSGSGAAPSGDGFSSASWPRSFMASSKRDRYFWRPRRGEPSPWPSSPGARSPLGLWRISPTPSGSPPESGSGEPVRSGVEPRDRPPGAEASDRKGGGEEDERGSARSRSRWNRGSEARRSAAAEGAKHQV